MNSEFICQISDLYYTPICIQILVGVLAVVLLLVHLVVVFDNRAPFVLIFQKLNKKDKYQCFSGRFFLGGGSDFSFRKYHTLINVKCGLIMFWQFIYNFLQLIEKNILTIYIFTFTLIEYLYLLQKGFNMSFDNFWYLVYYC